MKQPNLHTNQLTDKAFLRFMLVSILGILLCITCLCSATWAWFSSSTSSNQNKLKTGQFNLNVNVTEVNASEPLTPQDGSLCYKLPEATSYTVTLTITDDTTVTKGFCILYVNDQPYYTDVFYSDTESFTFTLTTTQADTIVTFSPVWGIPSAEDKVGNGGSLTLTPAAGTAP